MSFDCPICFKTCYGSLKCGHYFCSKCIQTWKNACTQETTCPTCREPFSEENIQNIVEKERQAKIAREKRERKAKIAREERDAVCEIVWMLATIVSFPDNPHMQSPAYRKEVIEGKVKPHPTRRPIEDLIKRGFPAKIFKPEPVDTCMCLDCINRRRQMVGMNSILKYAPGAKKVSCGKFKNEYFKSEKKNESIPKKR